MLDEFKPCVSPFQTTDRSEFQSPCRSGVSKRISTRATYRKTYTMGLAAHEVRFGIWPPGHNLDTPAVGVQ